MGLGIAQVRLLALTHRKSDIELEMSINSKRKQQLTRKSTELSQAYYAKLNNYNYQYSTKGGYNDLDYDYLMGQSLTTGSYTTDFKKQILNQTNEIPYKIDENVVLANNKGQVILNNEMALCCQRAELFDYTGTNIIDSGDTPSTLDKTAYAVWSFIKDNSEEIDEYWTLDQRLEGELIADGSNLSVPDIVKIIRQLIELGGPGFGGTVFVNNGEPVTTTDTDSNGDTIVDYSQDLTSNNSYWDGSAEKIQEHFDAVTSEANQNHFYVDKDSTKKAVLKAGCCYTVSALVPSASGTGFNAVETGVNECYWDGSKFIPLLRFSDVQKLYNIAKTLAPMLSSALHNGFASNIKMNTVEKNYGAGAAQLPGAINLIKNDSTIENNTLVKVIRPGHSTWYFAKINSSEVYKISPNTYNAMSGSAEYTADFQSVQDTDALQDGLKSGLYQLCMVDNVKSGALKKNTMMDYFVHRNLCIEKVDTSKREELTAWYNAEQAAISNQENYWDEEISNLSTELTSINTEIDSVKSLKTNAIKSVFGWGSQ